MSPLKDPAALAHLEKRMMDTFGVSHHEYDGGVASNPVPKAYFNAAIRVTDNSGIVDLLTRWDGERRKSNAGKKAAIPLRALVVLYLLNTQMGLGVSYTELARTLTYRFTAEHFAALGIRPERHGVYIWYRRVSDTTYRLIALMNSRPSPLRAVLDAEAFAALLRRADTPSALALAERNQDRLDQFCNLLVEASLHCLPRDIWEKYRGNISIDATKADIRGPRNSSSYLGARGNPDPWAGRYRREGNHDGQGAKTDVMAYELETAVMIWNNPGENTLFPSLVTAISCHNPGALTGHAAELIRRQRALGFERFTVTADRAYNGEAIENFHIPAAAAGVDLVIDYKKIDLGIQSHYEDLILVDGSWYVNWMPTRLIDASKELRDVEIAVEDAKSVLYYEAHPSTKAPKQSDAAKQLEAELLARETLSASVGKLESLSVRLGNREPYRMIAKGRPDGDGFQRLSYPPRQNMLVQPTNHPITVTSITVPSILPFNEAVAAGKTSVRKTRAESESDVRSKAQPIKFTQRFPYKSPQWHAHYGMRNLVEASNSLLKTAPHGDIENTAKRSGRGYAATYIALTFAVVASNLKRIVTFFVAEATRIEDNVIKGRSRRRKDSLGRPLQKAAPVKPTTP